MAYLDLGSTNGNQTPAGVPEAKLFERWRANRSPSLWLVSCFSFVGGYLFWVLVFFFMEIQRERIRGYQNLDTRPCLIINHTRTDVHDRAALCSKQLGYQTNRTSFWAHSTGIIVHAYGFVCKRVCIHGHCALHKRPLVGLFLPLLAPTKLTLRGGLHSLLALLNILDVQVGIPLLVALFSWIPFGH